MSPPRSGPRGNATVTNGSRRDGLILAALAAGSFAWFLLPYGLGGYGLPLGPDAPVYLWWIRVVGVDGLSAVGHRPGVPALALAARGTLGLSEVEIVAALAGVLGVATGLASAALLRAGRGRRAAWTLAGVLAGTFAVHLAAGYLANLAFAATFLGAAAMLAAGTRRGAVGAAVVLGAGGLAHPLFFLVGGGVLLLSATLAWRRDRAEAIRVGGAALGAGALLGVGSLALLAGPGHLEVDTSKDAFLRRAGLTDELRAAYLDRFLHRSARYVQWASVPLGVAGLRPAEGFVGRFLRAWGLVTVVGITVSLATGIAPADRFVTFGFVVPLLAALGLVRLWDALGARPAIAAAATGALTIAMLAGAWIAWDRQAPFMSELEVRRITQASAWIDLAEPSTALVFPVNDDDASVTFLATRAGNVIRAAVPPSRIRDVVVVVPAPRDPADDVRRALTRVTLADATTAIAEREGSHLDVLLAPFDRVGLGEATAQGSPWRRVSTGVFVSGAMGGDALSSPATPLEPSSPAKIAWAMVATLALLGVAGYGWSRAAVSDGVNAAAISPAVGAAALTISALVLERIGMPLDGSGVTEVLASTLGGGSGYLVWLVLERRTDTRSMPEVDE